MTCQKPKLPKNRSRSRPHRNAMSELRQDLVFHSTPAGAFDCGLMLKPKAAQAGYVDRICDDYIGILVLRGTGVFTDWNDRTWYVSPGSFIQHPPRLRHSVVPNDPTWAEFYFRFPSPQYRALHELQLIDDRPLLHPGLSADFFQRMEQMLAEAHAAVQSDLPLLLVRMHEMLVIIQRMDRHAGQRERERSIIDLACRSLGERLDESLDLADLASDLGLGYERFRKLFRQHVGHAPGEYRIRRRLDAARRLLRHDGLSIKETAYRLGYPDPFTFSRQFKRFTGQTPSTFQQTT